MQKENPRIVIVMDGGIIQSITTDQPIDILILDYDIGGADPDEIENDADGKAVYGRLIEMTDESYEVWGAGVNGAFNVHNNQKKGE